MKYTLPWLSIITQKEFRELNKGMKIFPTSANTTEHSTCFLGRNTTIYSHWECKSTIGINKQSCSTQCWLFWPSACSPKWLHWNQNFSCCSCYYQLHVSFFQTQRAENSILYQRIYNLIQCLLKSIETNHWLHRELAFKPESVNCTSRPLRECHWKQMGLSVRGHMELGSLWIIKLDE